MAHFELGDSTTNLYQFSRHPHLRKRNAARNEKCNRMNHYESVIDHTKQSWYSRNASLQLLQSGQSSVSKTHLSESIHQEVMKDDRLTQNPTIDNGLLMHMSGFIFREDYLNDTYVPRQPAVSWMDRGFELCSCQ
ncbi:Hypothetical_protein [Hexamita inflata]|uniref:Hypothetical_protein n=1 Tax=Hexamita inflata TaxID=28002 RepID=A0AA86PLL2_9EUKA|nr:Hypothetical protein HINF_LOCUS28436 [Hexamita inflata]